MFVVCIRVTNNLGGNNLGDVTEVDSFGNIMNVWSESPLCTNDRKIEKSQCSPENMADRDESVAGTRFVAWILLLSDALFSS